MVGLRSLKHLLEAPPVTEAPPTKRSKPLHQPYLSLSFCPLSFSSFITLFRCTPSQSFDFLLSFVLCAQVRAGLPVRHNLRNHQKEFTAYTTRPIYRYEDAGQNTPRLLGLGPGLSRMRSHPSAHSCHDACRSQSTANSRQGCDQSSAGPLSFDR